MIRTIIIIIIIIIKVIFKKKNTCENEFIYHIIMKIESHSQGHSQAAQWPSSARGASLSVGKACQGAAEMSYCWVVLLIP